MKKRIFISMFLIMLIYTCCETPLNAAPSTNIIIQTIGTVQYLKAGAFAYKSAVIRTKLEAGDTIITKAKSSVRLAILNGDGVITMGADSKLVLTEQQKDKAAVKTPGFLLFMGNIKTKISRKQTGDIDFSSPTAVVGVRGTEFDIAVADDGTSKVGVSHGLVGVQGQSGQTSLASNESSIVPLAGAPKDKVPYSSAENLESWMKTTSSGIKGHEAEILTRVSEALEYNYTQIDKLLAQDAAMKKKIEENKTARKVFLENGKKDEADKIGQETMNLIGDGSRVNNNLFFLDVKNQSIFEIAQRIRKKKGSDAAFMEQFNRIDTRFSHYHSQFVTTPQRKGCI